VIFEDDRTGHPEVWAKRKILGAWGPDSCVTCDEFDSARPALDRLAARGRSGHGSGRRSLEPGRDRADGN
jgi:hypothetical protein